MSLQLSRNAPKERVENELPLVLDYVIVYLANDEEVLNEEQLGAENWWKEKRREKEKNETVKC